MPRSIALALALFFLQAGSASTAICGTSAGLDDEESQTPPRKEPNLKNDNEPKSLEGPAKTASDFSERETAQYIFRQIVENRRKSVDDTLCAGGYGPIKSRYNLLEIKLRYSKPIITIETEFDFVSECFSYEPPQHNRIYEVIKLDLSYDPMEIQFKGISRADGMFNVGASYLLVRCNDYCVSIWRDSGQSSPQWRKKAHFEGLYLQDQTSMTRLNKALTHLRTFIQKRQKDPFD